MLYDDFNDLNIPERDEVDTFKDEMTHLAGEFVVCDLNLKESIDSWKIHLESLPKTDHVDLDKLYEGRNLYHEMNNNKRELQRVTEELLNKIHSGYRSVKIKLGHPSYTGEKFMIIDRSANLVRLG